MNLPKQAMKLRGAVFRIQLKRCKSGFPSNYFSGAWGDCSHVINRGAMVHIPLWKKVTWGTVWVTGMFTYPLYVTYKMYDWDRLDENL